MWLGILNRLLLIILDPKIMRLLVDHFCWGVLIGSSIISSMSFSHMVNFLKFQTLRSCQTVQIHIRLLLIRFFPVCYSDKHFVNYNHDNQHLNRKRKVFKILEFLLIFNIYLIQANLTLLHGNNKGPDQPVQSYQRLCCSLPVKYIVSWLASYISNF